MMWHKLRQALCWLLNGRNEMECLFESLDPKPKKICDGCIHNEWRKEDKMLICDICGYEIVPDINDHYISINAGQTGIATAFRKDEEEIFDTFDCKKCGCQHIAQPRKRAYGALNLERISLITNDEQEESDED